MTQLALASRLDALARRAEVENPSRPAAAVFFGDFPFLAFFTPGVSLLFLAALCLADIFLSCCDWFLRIVAWSCLPSLVL